MGADEMEQKPRKGSAGTGTKKSTRALLVGGQEKLRKER